MFNCLTIRLFLTSFLVSAKQAFALDMFSLQVRLILNDLLVFLIDPMIWFDLISKFNDLI